MPVVAPVGVLSVMSQHTVCWPDGGDGVLPCKACMSWFHLAAMASIYDLAVGGESPLWGEGSG